MGFAKVGNFQNKHVFFSFVILYCTSTHCGHMERIKILNADSTVSAFWASSVQC